MQFATLLVRHLGLFIIAHSGPRCANAVPELYCSSNTMALSKGGK